MASFSRSSVDVLRVPDKIQHGLPRLIDEHNLAHVLGIKTRTLWFFIRACSTPIDDPKSAYRHFAIPKTKKHGAVKLRHIFVMKSRTEDMQKVLTNVFVKPIPVGEQVAAYEAGKSTIDASAFCAGSKVLIKMDCRDFFPSIRRSWIRKYYERLGYQRNVASLIAQLFCTARTYRNGDKTIKVNFLPMGSIAAPFIANRIAEDLIDRPVMQYLARLQAAGTDIRYIRYSDNLYFPCFSHLRKADSEKITSELVELIETSGWKTHKVLQVPYYRKQKVLGLVVNEKANVDVNDYKFYRAVLYNCANKDLDAEMKRYMKITGTTFVSTGQFLSHLSGKIAWYSRSITEHRAKQLNTWLDQIREKTYTGDLKNVFVLDFNETSEENE